MCSSPIHELMDSRRFARGQRLAFQHFHRVCKNVILMIRVCRCFRRGLKGFSCFHLIEKDTRGEIEEDKKKANAVFDRHEFSVSKEHFPFRAIQITKKSPAWRTDNEIKHLQNRLQFLESFRQYSPVLQSLLAKVIRFERFGRRRVIIKKGHQADSFYFIYCGSVAITDDDDGGSAFVEAAPTTIRRGACFGEIALLQNTRRVATVVCLEETELLVVDKSDFFAYELDKELNREFKYRYEFLRSADLFETLPDSSVAKIAYYCKIERSHYGQVITSDITDSSTMIFITKGVCEVLRLVDLSTCPSYHKWISKQLCFPKRKLQMMDKRRIAAEIACVDRFKSTMWNSFSGERLKDLKDFYISHRNEQYDQFMKQDSLFNREHKSVVINVDKSPFINKHHGDDGPEVVQKIISGEFRKEPLYSTSYGEMPTSVAAAVYIKMDELRKGEMIANLHDSRVIVLVSQGAEIIRLKKERVEEWADAATMLKFGKIKMKYPSDDELCQVFLRQNSWESFKKDLLGIVMRPKLMKMVHPPHPCPTEEIYDPWCVNQAGVLDLSQMRHQKEPSTSEKYKFVPVGVEQEKQSLPYIQPRLIHSITVLRSPLDGAF
ncbi:cyclic nucleotide-binding domain-containing protein 2 [Zootoca vivipara]|uniref:cyclic nucleotide-binding domain-containing protein 2 n=1 Tax=Zootoca vivipara TaxID=8524 RepID=UPI00293BE2C8|nr:cyclic nucleotide-binding domain-containing protein 2 [Zootoca vivipara]